MLYMLYCDMGVEEQSKVFALLGQSLNHSILEASKDGYKFAKDIDLENLKEGSKVEMYENCEPRLKSFIDSVTDNIKYENSNINYQSNVFENILKAPNAKFVSTAGLKKHMVAYLSSGKSIHASQVFSKQGGKGTMPVL